MSLTDPPVSTAKPLRIAQVIAYAVAYAIGGVLAHQLAVPPYYATAFWFPAGLALLARVRCGPWAWLAIFVGAIAANSQILAGMNSWSSLLRVMWVPVTMGIGAASSAVVTYTLLERFARFPRLPNSKHLFTIAAFLVPAGTAVSALIGSATLVASGTVAKSLAATTFLTWWVGDVVGVLMLLPLLYFRGWRHPSRIAFVRSVVTPLVIALGFAMAAFWQVARNEAQRLNQLLKDDTLYLASTIERGALAARQQTELLAAFFAASKSVDDAEFAFLARSLQNLQRIRWLTFVPVNTPTVPSSRSVGDLPQNVRLDLIRSAEVQSLMERAAATGVTQGSAPIKLSSDGAHLEVVYVVPVLQSSEPGWVLGMYDLDHVVAEDLGAQQADLGWTVSASDDQRKTVVRDQGLGMFWAGVRPHQHPVNLRPWAGTLTVTPGGQFLKHHHVVNLWFAQLSCVVMAGFWGLFVLGQWVRGQRLVAMTKTLEDRNHALNRSQAQFRRLADASPVAIFQSNAEGEVQYANEEFSWLMGYDRGAHRAEVVHERDHEAFSRLSGPALQEGRELSQQFRLRSPKAGLRWVLARVQPLRAADGSIDGQVGTFIDITEMRQREQALSALNSCPRNDLNLAMRHLCRALASCLDTPVAFVLRYRSLDADEGDLLACWQDGDFAEPTKMSLRGTPCVHVGRQGSMVVPQGIQTRFPDDPRLKALGAEGYAAMSLRDSRGVALGVVGVMSRGKLSGGEVPTLLDLFRSGIEAHLQADKHDTEMTATLASLESRVGARTQDLQTALERVAEGEKQLRALTDNLPGVVFQTVREDDDKPLQLAFISNGLAKLLDRPVGNPIGRLDALKDWIHPDDLPGLVASIQRPAVRDTGRWHHEFRITTSAGMLCWTRAEAFRVVEGRRRVWNGFWVDVSEAKFQETALRSAKEAADRASRAKSEFLAMMSHEIRTPMNSALGLLELVLLSGLAPDQRSLVETAQDAAQSLLRLIDDLLDFSRIEAGRLDLAPEPAALEEVLGRIATLYSDALSVKGLTFKTEIDPQVAPAHWVDRLRLRQILGNLLSNAIKFTEEGSICIQLKVLQDDAAQQRLEFRVIDTGVGCSPDQLSRLFQAFQQAEAGTFKRFGGTGLGLAISRRLAERMGGSLRMESTLGEGSTLILEVPLPKADAAALAAARAQSVQESQNQLRRDPPRPPAQGLRILAVEDHAPSRMMIERQISLLGYAVDTAADGEEAWDLWQKGDYAAVITDCHMPRCDGYELVARIRAVQEVNDKTCLLVGCTAGAGTLQPDSKVFDHLLIKPLSLTRLRQTLEQGLTGRVAKTPATVTPDAPKPASTLAATAASHAPSQVRARALEALQELAGGDADAASALLDEFARTLVTDAEALRTALKERHADESYRAAHRLKGAVAALGAHQLAQQLDTMQKAARQGELIGLSALLDQLWPHLMAFSRSST